MSYLKVSYCVIILFVTDALFAIAEYNNVIKICAIKNFKAGTVLLKYLIESVYCQKNWEEVDLAVYICFFGNARKLKYKQLFSCKKCIIGIWAIRLSCTINYMKYWNRQWDSWSHDYVILETITSLFPLHNFLRLCR